MVGGDGHSLEVVVAAPWGSGADEVDELLEDYPAFADMSPDQMRQVRAQLRIRLDADGGLHALADAAARLNDGCAVVHHFDARGGAAGRTQVPRGDPGTRIVDYAVGPDHSTYLLERTPSAPGAPRSRLRKIDRSGRVTWSRECTFRCLLFDGRDGLFGPIADQPAAIAQIDVASGATVEVHESGVHGDDVFMAPSGTVQSVAYFPEARRRGIAISRPRSGRPWTAIPFGADAYRWLTWPIGVDAASNVYGWNDGTIARVSPDGGVVVLAAFDGIAVGPDGSVISSRLIAREGESAVLQIDRRAPASAAWSATEPMTLPLPAALPAGGDWRIIDVDRLGRFYVLGGEAPGTPGTLLVYSHDGRLEDTIARPPDLLALESRLASHRDWIVDADGRILLPMTDPGGFKVLRLQASESPLGELRPGLAEGRRVPGQEGGPAPSGGHTARLLRDPCW